ncbi:PH domain-containing protein, partial [Staphylococcus epidermidis]
NPFNIQFELSSIVRYRTSKGLLGNKLFIYYSDQEWYKFSNLSKSDLNKLTKYLY